jgi:fatty-acyl-CoA synthase
VIDILGQTEMTSTILVHAEPQNIERTPTAVGLPTPGVAVALLDERSVPVPAGEIGELCYLGESLMLGYWNKPEATAEAMAGGWFHSGDLGRRDEDGIIFIAGRKKDLMKSRIFCGAWKMSPTPACLAWPTMRGANACTPFLR